MAKFFSSYARHSQVDALTSPNDAPAPIYALEELCDLVARSEEGVAVDIANYLCTSRLDNKSPVVKLKVLKAIKYIAGKPQSSQFRTALQSHAGKIRDLFSFRCSPDPLKGDRPAQAVRDAAKEAIHSVYTTNNSYAESSAAVRSENYSSVSSSGAAPQSHPSGAAPMPFQPNPYAVSSTDSSVGTSPGASTATASRGLGGIRRWSRSGANGSGANGTAAVDGGGMLSGAGLEAPRPVPLRSAALAGSHAEDALDLLAQVCKPVGLKAQPREDQLRAFISAAQDADMAALKCEVEGKLADASWQVSYRALCALHALLECPSKSFASAAKDAFAGDLALLGSLATHQNQTLAAKAARVLREHFGGAGDAQKRRIAPPPASRGLEPAGASAATRQPQPQPQGDLLGFDMGGGDSLAAQLAGPEQVQGGQPQAQTGELFAGMSLEPQSSPAKATPAPAPASGGLFQGLDVRVEAPAAPQQPPPLAAVAPVAVQDPLAGMGMGVPQAVPPMAAPGAAAAPHVPSQAFGVPQTQQPVAGMMPMPMPMPMMPMGMGQPQTGPAMQAPTPQYAYGGMYAPQMAGVMPGPYGAPPGAYGQVPMHGAGLAQPTPVMPQNGFNALLGGGMMPPGSQMPYPAAMVGRQGSPGLQRELSPSNFAMHQKVVSSTRIEGSSRAEPAFDFISEHITNAKQSSHR